MNTITNIEGLQVSPAITKLLYWNAVFRPMLFSTASVQALLDGRKTQTRRIIKHNCKINEVKPVMRCLGNEKDWGKFKLENEFGEDYIYKTPVSQCDFIWVRETFNTNYNDTGYIYKADYKEPAKNKQFWKPSLFMPRSACRIFLEVTDIRIERLQGISEEDAEKEGINIIGHNCYENYLVKKDWIFAGMNQKNYHMIQDPIGSYASLWDSINGLGSWEENPFVWVYSFKVVECPNGFR